MRPMPLLALLVAGSVLAGPVPAVAGPSGGPPDPALAAAVAQWVVDGGESDLQALGSDFGDLETAAGSEDLQRMGASCDRLRGDVEAAQQHDPIPDAQAQQDWAAALALYDRGATDCVAGTGTTNTDLINQASDEITQGSDDLARVTDRLTRIAG